MVREDAFYVFGRRPYERGWDFFWTDTLEMSLALAGFLQLTDPSSHVKWACISIELFPVY